MQRVKKCDAVRIILDVMSAWLDRQTDRRTEMVNNIAIGKLARADARWKV